MPTRSCVICRKKDEKANLLRIVASDENKAMYDKLQKENKRAIYFCKSEECLGLAVKMIEKKKFRAKIGINLESLEVLLNEIKKELGE